MKISQVLIPFLIFTIIIGLPPAGLQYTGNAEWLQHGFWAMFVFMFIVTLLLLTGMTLVKMRSPDFFAQGFLAGTTVKILACFVFIFVFLRNNTINKPIFVADFMYLYLLNTVFEIYTLLSTLRDRN